MAGKSPCAHFKRGGDAGPVRTLLGGEDSPAASFCSCSPPNGWGKWQAYSIVLGAGPPAPKFPSFPPTAREEDCLRFELPGLYNGQSWLALA
jgi:hypothetical protein